jgi:hypothetical protein
MSVRTEVSQAGQRTGAAVALNRSVNDGRDNTSGPAGSGCGE